ncbi:peptidoglycan/xylan/chitin deacetylase (PgdA/CDA1 family) [Luteibacter sp. Sphag1AF]|uniref:polysaccharide deacetylase family protein n=1 Tax=Luteibacter sp. Sphag1AF TaxID=2587031 RepID=UPI001608B686|nr:polysaccharide deacetylase family protein [Luteibacter sp. Sphag1AF]MBB3228573.1 peptidoglycan/xylan/chitin deacetylase (PgdA/CDA1 family) [Luteibacter sp. Sphag1AF]
MKRTTLMYHDVVTDSAHCDDSGFTGAAAAHYKLDTALFERHLKALLATGLRFPAVQSSTDTDVILTFDDGGSSARHIGALLDEHGMTGHFFITTARIGQPGFVTPADLRALREAGHVIGSHSHTHPHDISRLPRAQLESEWTQSLSILSGLLGQAIDCASVPGGFTSESVKNAVSSCGIKYLFTSEPVTTIGKSAGCDVLGRYAMFRASSERDAHHLALNKGFLRESQWLSWNAKRPLKRWARPAYALIRQWKLGAD